MSASESQPAVQARGLVKSFGDVRALDGVDIDVPAGTVLGLLGPNGAGKTTVVRILSTVIEPDAGEARVMGLDVVRDAPLVRTRIGLAGQFAAVDGNLTGRENLRLIGALTHLPRRAIGPRADELLEQFGLSDAGGRPARTYSGGMRRRLDLAAALVHRPPVLFLDEPTTGPRPGQPQRPLGHRPGAGGRRHHRPAHHPVPRGGRPPGGPHRGDRPRGRPRRGHRRRSEAPPRRDRAGADRPGRRRGAAGGGHPRPAGAGAGGARRPRAAPERERRHARPDRRRAGAGRRRHRAGHRGRARAVPGRRVPGPHRPAGRARDRRGRRGGRRAAARGRSWHEHHRTPHPVPHRGERAGRASASARATSSP